MSVPQLPLPLRFPQARRFDAFEGAAGIVAQLGALASGDAPGALFLAGPAGSGKTHLLLAAGAAAEAAGRRAAYLPLAALSGQLRASIEGVEQADLICLDGVEAVAGTREDEIALFDLHNRARDRGASLLYAAGATPAQLALDLPDLRSRLGQCILLQLAVLPEDARRRVLRQRAAARGLELDEAALDYLFARVGRDLKGLLDLLDRIDRESLAAKRRITVPFLRGLVG
jgi:DnaA-homolog protein